MWWVSRCSCWPWQRWVSARSESPNTPQKATGLPGHSWVLLAVHCWLCYCGNTTNAAPNWHSLKVRSITEPILGYREPYGSACGIDGMLTQMQGGTECMAAYYIDMLTPAEKNYCMAWRELLAVMQSMKQFILYLYKKVLSENWPCFSAIGFQAYRTLWPDGHMAGVASQVLV